MSTQRNILLYINLTTCLKLVNNVLCRTKLPPLHGSQKSPNVSDTVTLKWTHRHTKAQVTNTKTENNPEATEEEEDRGHERNGKINTGDAERNRTDVRTKTDKLTKSEGKTREWITKHVHAEERMKNRQRQEVKDQALMGKKNGKQKTQNMTMLSYVKV